MATLHQKIWTAWGYVVASALPIGRLELGQNVRIEPVEVCPPQLLSARPQINHTMNLGPEYSSSVPAEVVVRGSHVIWFKCNASTMEAAWSYIENTQLPLVTAALANSIDIPPRIELLRIAQLFRDGRMGEILSPWMVTTFTSYRAREMSAIEMQKLLERHNIIERLASGPSRSYQEALRLQDSGDLSPRGLANVVLSYFLVVEAITRTVKQVPSFGGIAGIEAAKLVAQLRLTIGRTEEPATHLKNIRATVKKMEALEERSFRPKLLHLADQLGLPNEVVSETLAIAKLRNSTLAHSGRDASEDLSSWVVRAELAARTILTAYIQSLLEPLSTPA